MEEVDQGVYYYHYHYVSRQWQHDNKVIFSKRDPDAHFRI